MLPFDIVSNQSWFEITPEIRVPRYGSLTIAEAIALEKLITPELSKLLDNPLIQIEAMLHFRSVLSSVLLISRYEAATTLADVLETLSLEAIVASSDFLLQERADTLARSPQNKPDESPEPLDWADLYWKLHRHYPHEPRFRADRFGNCPIVLARQAIESLEKERLQQLSAEAMPLSIYGCFSLAKQGEKNPKPEWFNPFLRQLERDSARALIPEESARLFLDLCAEQQIPAWAVAAVDIEKIRRAADG